MTAGPGKRVARVKLRLTKEAVERLKPADKPWVAWDDGVTGFGVRIQPSGFKAFFVAYRPGGGRRAPSRKLVIGRYGMVEPAEARRLARQILGRAARGDDPAAERAERRRIPTLATAFDEYLVATPGRKASTEELYRGQMQYCFGDWLRRPLDLITRRDVEARFNRLTTRHGWAVANHAISLLRGVFRRPCADFQQLRNPVDLWLAAGGRYHRPVRRAHLHARRRAAPLAGGHRGRGRGGGDPRHLLGRDVHRDAARRDRGARLEAGGPRSARPAG